MSYVLLLGRILFSSIFILKSFCHFSPTIIDKAAHAGVPLAVLLVPVAGLLCLLGGLSILLGYKAKMGAWFLIIFLVPVTLIMHRFWEMKGGPFAFLHEFCFMKNMSLLGALLMISYFGSGPLSLSKTSSKK